MPQKRGIKILSVFAFSTENFKRSEEEVTYLMDLLIKYFKKEIKTFQNITLELKFQEEKDRLREDVLKAIDNVEDKTSKNTGGILNICLNYGGQEEIIDASKKNST